MNIKEKLIQEYPLIEKIDSDICCYSLTKKRYLVFWDGLINKDDIKNVLDQLQDKTQSDLFSKWKTLIIVGNTNDDFCKEDLFYFNGVDTFVVFYLIDENKNKIYMNDSWIYALGCNFRKFVRKIDAIVKKHCSL